MALRNAVMAALLEGEASGYDLAKGFEASVANFWMATPQQIYRELERVERATAKLARYERLQERLLAGRAEDEYLATAERVGPYLTLLGGMALERANLQWGETVLERLERRASALGGPEGARRTRPRPRRGAVGP